MTKREALTAMREIPENADYVEFIDAEIEALDKKAANAKKYKAKKDANTEKEKELIEGALSPDAMTVNEVLEAVEDSIEGITRSKVIARLKSLVDEGKAARVEVTSDEGKKVKGYVISDGVIDNEAR